VNHLCPFSETSRTAGECAFSLLSPSLSVTLSIDETSRPTFLRSGVTGLLEASVGRWLRFLIEAVPPRHGHIMPELARDMRHVSMSSADCPG
jgi:hypothetical protein